MRIKKGHAPKLDGKKARYTSKESMAEAKVAGACYNFRAGCSKVTEEFPVADTVDSVRFIMTNEICSGVK